MVTILDPMASPYTSEMIPDVGSTICNDVQFDLALKFNVFPSTYVHSSWLEKISTRCGGIPIGTGANSGQAYWLRTLSMALLKWRKVDAAYDFDFSDLGKRVALLPAAHLQEVASHLAAVLIRDDLRRLITGASVRQVSEAIGESVRVFALTWMGDNEALNVLPANLRRRLFSVCQDTDEWGQASLALLLSVVPPDSIGVRIPRGSVLLASAPFIPAQFGKPMVERGISDYQRAYDLQKDVLMTMGSHPRFPTRSRSAASTPS